VTQPRCEAVSPFGFSGRDIWHILKCTWREIKDDNVAIIAAGVAFFTMLAIFPLITACLSIYGYVADPNTAQQHLLIVSDLIGLLIALWAAGSGIRAMMRALTIAYGEKEKRHAAKFYGLASMLTLSMTIFIWASLAVIVGLPALLALLKLDGMTGTVTRYLPWVLLVTIFAMTTTILYRYGPSRRPAKKRWLFPGVIFATLSWLAISVSFSRFVSTFDTYNATYGSLSAVIILLIWFWLTAFVVIIGAELNAEMERHTCVDTTRGPDRPIGERGAAMADYTGHL